MKTPPWDLEMANGIKKWLNRINPSKGAPPENIEDIHHLNMALMILVATSLTSHIDKEDLELLDRMARAGLRAMLLELGHEADQPQAPEEAGGSP